MINTDKNCLIIVESLYNANTYKIGKAMAQQMKCQLLTCDEALKKDLSKYEVLGLGSGIYFTEHHPKIFQLVEKINSQKTKILIFSTCGNPFAGNKYHFKLRKLLKKRKVVILGEFATPGYDCTGPFNLIGGGNKGRPNQSDLVNAKKFIQSNVPQQYDLPSPVKKNVQINNKRCISCGKCVNVCPMDVFRQSDSEISVKKEKSCTHCNLCTDQCPTNAIIIRHNTFELINIAYKHRKKKGLD